MSVFAIFLRGCDSRRSDAEVIFDRDEPVGQATDLVMPRRRWFRRSEEANKDRLGATSSGKGSRPTS
jgi:hypothetical protein